MCHPAPAPLLCHGKDKTTGQIQITVANTVEVTMQAPTTVSVFELQKLLLLQEVKKDWTVRSHPGRNNEEYEFFGSESEYRRKANGLY